MTTTRSKRPYASALGFYVGDRVEVSLPNSDYTGLLGRVDFVNGPDFNTVIVVLDDTRRVYVMDEDLTRLAE